MWSIFHLPDPNRSLEKWLFLNAEQHLAFIQSISGYWYGPRVKETEGKFSQWWNDGARAFWRGARKWIRHKHRDKEPRVVINNPGGGRGSTVRTLQPTWDIISRLQHLLEDMPLPHPTESIYIDSAFEQSMWVSPQVEPNYSETPQEGSASGRMIISWLDWENKTKLRQINNDGKAAVSGGAGSDESRMKEGRSNVTPGRGVFWMRPCCLRFKETWAQPVDTMKESAARTRVWEYLIPELLICLLSITLSLSPLRPGADFWSLYPDRFSRLLSTKWTSR